MLWLLRGALAFAFVIVAWLVPFPMVAALMVLFGGFALLDGGFALMLAFTSRGPPQWVNAFWLEGLISVLAGMVMIFSPGLGLHSLVVVIGVWAITSGVVEVIAAYRAGSHLMGRALLAVAGGASVATGSLVLLWPNDRSLVFFVAAYAFVFGVLTTTFAVRLRSWILRRSRRSRDEGAHDVLGQATPSGAR